MSDSNTPSQPPPPRQILITTPSRRALSAEPPTTLRRRLLIRTPGSSTTRPTPTTNLSASARRHRQNHQNNHNAPPTATTPHGRAALRALDSRRAAIFTPGRAGGAGIGRRRSLRDVQRETPRDFLRALARNLAPKTEVVHTSSSPPVDGDGKGDVKSELASDPGFLGGDDDEEGELRVPRMSLPLLDEDEELEQGDWPRPHRSAGLEDVDGGEYTVEFGRRGVRANSEGLGRRSSVFGGMGGRVSDVRAGFGLERFNEMGNLREEGDMGGFGAFPPLHEMDERMGLMPVVAEDHSEMFEYERLEGEADERRMTGRESDFGLVVPVGLDESTVFLQPDVEEEEHQDGEEEVTEAVPQVEAEPDADNEPFGMDEESHVHFADEFLDIPDDQEPQQDQDDEILDDEVEEEAEQFTMEVDSAVARNAPAATGKVRKKKKGGLRLSKYGIAYPQLPPAVVKRLAQTFAKTSGVKGRITPDTLAAIQTASDWFFEQVGDNLKDYAKHAGRKTIDESDVLLLMRRQRQINSSTTPFSLAQRYLPRELLQEMRMPPPVPIKKARAPKARVNDDDDEEVT